MKHMRFSLFVFLSFPVFLTGCRFDLFENMDACEPAVSTGEIRSQGDVLYLTGQIEDQGIYAVEYTGFCVSKQPDPHITDNQILLKGPDLSFRATVPEGFNEGDTLYYRAFAANECGYAIGTSKQFIYRIPETAVTVPCTVQENVIKMDSYTLGVSSVTQGASGSEYRFNAVLSGTNLTLRFRFSGIPATGLYQISGTLDPPWSGSEKPVIMICDYGMSSSVVGSGMIYVQKRADGSRRISFCNITIPPFGQKLTGQLVFPP